MSYMMYNMHQYDASIAPVIDETTTNTALTSEAQSSQPSRRKRLDFLQGARGSQGKVKIQHLVKTKLMNQKDGQCSKAMQLLYGLENTVQVKIEIKSLIEIKILSLIQHFSPDSLFFQTYKMSNGRKELLSNLNIYLCKQN